MGGITKNLPLGAAVTANITRGLPAGARLTCADNTGAKELEIISVKGYGGVRRRYPKAGVGDLIIATVKKGRPDIRKQVILAVVVRQSMPYTRFNGVKIRFEDNAAIVVGDDGMPKGTEIKGAVAKEAIERWKKIGALVSVVI
ncbi:MAG: 50S ribosomal protein L14 [Candidatus Altiarchaeales archaeon WOR_SM1_86-2]|nr:MAG: 50S ribosomal protein L14 [Candidatus Altiarchaeales archaeon WOR_SM1_79]ODS37535.1 MAG: 50S ribosomal protein L14 [Candidatus Altiarchaeales archaeon WOR_SM1_86-2]